MTRVPYQLRNNFSGSADELIDAAMQLGRKLKLQEETAESNERLLRHYVSMNVVDKPAREGRDAKYGFRHLAQFVAARRLLRDGLSLAKIAKITAIIPTDDLARYLESDDMSEAELLVAAFRVERPEQKEPVRDNRKPNPPRPLPNSAIGFGMVDVMQEMRHMEIRVQKVLEITKEELRAMVKEMTLSAGLGSQSSNSNLFGLQQSIEQMANEISVFMPQLRHVLEQNEKHQQYLFEQADKQMLLLKEMLLSLQQHQESRIEDLFNQQLVRFESLLLSYQIKGDQS